MAKKMGMWTVFLLLLSMFVMVGLLGVVDNSRPWKVFAEGTYASVEYTKVRRHHGPPVSYDYDDYNTIIRFTDGRTAIIHGQHPINFRTGTFVRILTKNSYYKFEKVESR
ncbi:MAG: hypothetical protein Q7S36_00275 [Candidatus Liptonbacteria bacterium]|nr:hypothetical protein [Candidatus Liptonbacteria bacterium]